MKTKSRLSFKVLLVILLSFMLLTTVSYAWFYANVNLGGNTIETDSLEYEAYGYNSTGEKVSTILNEGQPSTATNVNSPLYSGSGFTSGSETVYVSITSKSSLDLEYNLSIIARGYSSSDLNFTQLGGYWYRITDISSKVSTLSAYITSYKNTTESGTKLNMNVMNTSSIFGSIGSSDSKKIKYYRIDFGVEKANTGTTSNRIELFANVEVDQKGNTNNNQGSNQEFKVSDSATLINAIEAAGNNDTLYFTNNVEYFGDLIIRKSLHMNLGSKTLTVTGNVIYNFQVATTLKLDLSGSGKIKVLAGSGSDGNLIFDTPNAQIEIKGTSTNGGLIVENDIIISCSNEENKMGCHFSGVNAIKPNGSNATIKLNSNTTVTISSETNIASIVTEDNGMNIKVVNNGSINSIDLSNMRSSTQTASPQIYIHNYSTIDGIIVPSWSVKFEMGTSGTNSGNTKIANSFGAKISSLSGSSTFNKSHITEVASTILVESVDGTNTNLRILFKNKTNGTVTTVQSLLTEYFTNAGYTSNQAVQIQKITRLEIDSVSDKYLTTTDLSYINSTSLSGLKTLDLTDANIVNNTLPTNFYTQTNLKELILPKNLLRIDGNAFGKNVDITSLTIPKSVVSLGKDALLNIDYAIFESTTPPKPDVKGYIPEKTSTRITTIGSRYNFVPESSIEAYDNAFANLPPNNWTDYIMTTYPYSTLADDGVHFVRGLSDGTYELVTADSAKISTVVTSNKYVIGANLTVDGKPITISTIGRCAYLNCRTTSNYTVTFANSVHTVGWRSFDNAYFSNLDFCYVKNFSDYCGRGLDVTNWLKFSHGKTIEGECTFTESQIAKIDTGSLIEINGASTFSACSVTEMTCPNLIVLGHGAVYRCKKLKTIYTPKVEVISTNGLCENDRLYEIKLPAIREVGYASLQKNLSCVYLYLGPNLNSIEKRALDYCKALQYLCIESRFSFEIRALNHVNTSAEINNGSDYGITVKNIYVTPEAYSGYYSAATADNKLNFKDFGNIQVGTYTLELNYSDAFLANYNVGEYMVRVENEGVVIVSYNKPADKGVAKIPSKLTVNGVEMPVIGIGRNAFKNCTNITTIDFPEVTTAGAGAFEGCTNLTSVYVPKLTHWPANLFKGCTNLTKIVSECQFTSEASAISGNTKITNITINYYANNSNELPGTDAFTNLKSQSKNVVLYVKAQSLATFKANSTFNALNLTALEQKVTDINNSSIYYYLTERVVNSTTYYQIEYVTGSTSNSSLTIPASYDSKNIIGANIGAYDGISALTITIPQYYIYVNDGEFSDVTGLTSISVNTNNTKLSATDGVLYSKDKTELITYPVNRTGASYTTDSTTKMIRNSAFSNVKNLETINFNSNLAYIGLDAFKGSTVSVFVFDSTTIPYLMGAYALGTDVTHIKVPSSAVDSYKAANNYRVYASKVVAK